MTALLLDTCAIIFIANGEPMRAAARDLVSKAATQGDGVLVTPVSAWEIGMLAATTKKKVEFLPDPKTWFAEFVARPGVRQTPLAAETAIDASFLPGAFHGDPADRMLVAMARALNVPIVTRDRRILDYAAARHVKAVSC